MARAKGREDERESRRMKQVPSGAANTSRGKVVDIPRNCYLRRGEEVQSLGRTERRGQVGGRGKNNKGIRLGFAGRGPKRSGTRRVAVCYAHVTHS